MLLCRFSLQFVGKAIRAKQQVSESSPGSECLHSLGHGALLDAPEAGSSEEGCSLNPFCFQSVACSAEVIGDQEKQS